MTNYTTPVFITDDVKRKLCRDNYKYMNKQLNVLKAPAEVWTEIATQLDLPRKDRSINGCGSKSTWWVPESLFGLRVTPVCHIHDVTHSMSQNKDDCDFSNSLFLNNLVRYINANSNILMRFIRRHAGMTYYSFVYEARRAFCAGYKK